MSNAIEQTKREMYSVLSSLGGLTLRAENKELKFGQSATLEFQLFQSALEDHLEALRAELEYERKRANDAIESRDAMQLRLHAVDHAYSEQQSRSGTLAQDSSENVASEAPDPYMMGYRSAGRTCNPFPINTIERLHWNDGANDSRGRINQSAVRQEEGLWSGSIGCNGQASYVR